MMDSALGAAAARLPLSDIPRNTMNLYSIFTPPVKIETNIVGGPTKVRVDINRSVNLVVADFVIAEQFCKLAGEGAYPAKLEDVVDDVKIPQEVFLIGDSNSYDRYWKFQNAHPIDSSWISSFIRTVLFTDSEWKVDS